MSAMGAKVAKHFLWPPRARRFAGVGWPSKPAVSADSAVSANCFWQTKVHCFFACVLHVGQVGHVGRVGQLILANMGAFSVA